MKAYWFAPIMASFIAAPVPMYAEQAIDAVSSGLQNHTSQIVSSSAWEYPIIHFRNGTYRIMMDPAVSTIKVGPKLGKVERNISSFDQVDDDNSLIDTSYKNGDSNMLSVDTPIYKFRNRSTRDCIIVSHKNKYYKAIRKVDTSANRASSSSLQ
ncbi:hypothetical protein [Paenibacillus campi]|uniref:hypothetical protein n=1 Tax=Paenibacillus campi TaxID=3106031 RepID=UPI002AFE72F1|nr:MULTISPECIES: hypothetical protein [unclassified Paenibacillus]